MMASGNMAGNSNARRMPTHKSIANSSGAFKKTAV
jgi:hypothetical protein